MNDMPGIGLSGEGLSQDQSPVHITKVDGVALRLKSPFDLSFLRRYGEVFTVFDDQDSGNLCFGVRNGGRRLFVKFAGAPTAEYEGDPKDAVGRLKAVVPVYRELAHPSLIRLIEAEEIGGGYAAVFDWVESLCMGMQYPKSREKFMELSLKVRLKVYRDILAFHAHAAALHYVAVDFYDGSVLYDLEKGQGVICDIDFYEKGPLTNTMGRMWGSTRFMSPEEFVLGAAIDEVTNVYGMGAMAFAMFAEGDRTGENWPLGGASYDVVRRAASDGRDKRQRTIAQLMEEWEQSLS